MHLYVYDCVIHWDVHVGYSGSRCCADNFGTAGCRNNGLLEHCHGTNQHYNVSQIVTLLIIRPMSLFTSCHLCLSS